MLAAPLFTRRILTPPSPWSLGNGYTRFYTNNAGPNRRAAKGTREAAGREDVRDALHTPKAVAVSPAPSLIEQLFPEETKRYEEARRAASREIPRLPLEPVVPFSERRDDGLESKVALPFRTRVMQESMREEDARDRRTTILVLRNASPNLVEEDFRRLIPQGKHVEGWTLEQGDILKVVPARDLATLEHQNNYYLLFSSRLSAYTYQSQAFRIYQMAAAHTPISMTSPIPPPPGYMIDGMDSHAAIESFALVPAAQSFELRQLQPPLSPMLQSIIRHEGYACLVNRKDKMPFEVRLTLDGPQMHTSVIRFILHASGKERAWNWSGGDENIPPIAKWEPRAAVSPLDHDSQRARRFKVADERTEEEQMERDLANLERKMEKDRDASDTAQAQQQRRTPQLVYIVGFHTEHAAQCFISFWHKRPMAWKGVGSGKDVEEDLPPVTNVEMLW
ncbi:hypothetical protein LTR08_002944 [Meristemomyces frigidus]|nr:hypothetical protein LTR08_002944 [Meristemomyces frigidus]